MKRKENSYKFKKLVSALLSVMLIFVFVLPSSIVYADGTVYTEGKLKYTIDNGSVTIINNFGTDEVVTIPSSIGGYPVNSIASGAFPAGYVKTVNIPSCVTNIAGDAFSAGIKLNFTPLARVAGEEYFDIQEAVNRSNTIGSPVVLNTDVDAAFSLGYGKLKRYATIDLNGHTITADTINILSGSILTINGSGTVNGNITGEGTLNLDGDEVINGNISTILICSGGKVNGELNLLAGSSITGGCFTADPSAYLADGYKAVASNEDGYSYEVNEKKESYMIQTSSLLLSNEGTRINTSVAATAGGGIYESGADVNLSSSLLSYGAATNLKFLGWYKGEYSEENKVGTSTNLSLTADSNASYIAVYEANEDAEAVLTVEDENDVTVTKGSQNIEKEEAGYTTGVSSVSVSYNGSKNFKYWLNTSGHVIATGKSFDLTIVGNLTIIPVTYSSNAIITFKSDYEQVILNEEWDDSWGDNWKENLVIPSVPDKVGYTASGWLLDGEGLSGDQLKEAIKANVDAGKTDIVLTPYYIKDNNSVTLRVNYVDTDGNTLKDEETQSVTLGYGKTVTAPEIEGKIFNCFKLNGQIVSYSDFYKYVPSSTDETPILKVVYGDSAVDKIPVVTIINTFYENGKYKIETSYDVPEGYQFVEAGCYYADSKENLDNLKYVYQSNISTASGSFMLNIKTNLSEVYAKSYVTVIKPDGTTEKIFTEQTTISRVE